MTEKKWITEKELSEMTGRAVQTLRNDRHEGRGFPYVKMSDRAIRYCVADVNEYMKARKGHAVDFRVPLSGEMQSVIEQAKPFARDGFLFPSVSEIAPI